LLPYHRFGLSKYEFLGSGDYQLLSPELAKALQAIINEAFGRAAKASPAAK